MRMHRNFLLAASGLFAMSALAIFDSTKAADKATEKTVEKPASKSAEKTADKAAEKQEIKSANRPAHKPVDQAIAPALMQVAKSGRQWTGITVSKSRRTFVCFPRWSDSVPVSCAELMPDGSTRPFPDARWNQFKKDLPGNCFVCVQSVYADTDDKLWILDPAAPNFKGPILGGPKLLKVNLKNNAVERTYKFDNSICPANSYLNDIRIDKQRGKAYITESGLGAIIVLDLKTGQAKRMLDNHPSTDAEKIKIVINGKPWNLQPDGFSKKVCSDGIALDPEGQYLYYHALTGKSLYRVPTAELASDKASDESLGKVVEKVAETCVPDGIEFGDPDNLYLTSIEDNSIKKLNLKTKKQETVVQDRSMIWPDTLSLGPGGWMYVANSQINLMPNPPYPYRVYKFKVAK